jgi:hypothetical protein
MSKLNTSLKRYHKKSKNGGELAKKKDSKMGQVYKKDNNLAGLPPINGRLKSRTGKLPKGF